MDFTYTLDRNKQDSVTECPLNIEGAAVLVVITQQTFSQESARISAPNVEGHTREICASQTKTSWKSTVLECAICAVSKFYLNH